MNVKYKIRIAIVLIVSLFINQATFAGTFFYDNGKLRYLDDDGKPVAGWRWLDPNNDNICECYRFNVDGTLAASSSNIKGKLVNQDGCWVVDGRVQQIYKLTGEPLYEANSELGFKATTKYIDLGTLSNSKRINATKKDVKSMIEADLKKDDENYKKSLAGPKAEFVPSDTGFILSKGAKKLTKAPTATTSQWMVLNTAVEDDAVYGGATASVVAGRDMRRFVSESNKYTEKVDGAKIYGGEVWDDCICLSGNGASVTFKTTESRGNFKANYFTFEVAHQTHGESTSDTYCCLALYLNGDSITSYDDFCDAKPELVEEWLNEGETTVQLKAIVTGDAPGRKIYIRNARFRQIREVKEND